VKKQQRSEAAVVQNGGIGNPDAQARLGSYAGGATVVFEVAGQRYGLPVDNVVQIIEMVAITRLPKAPEIVDGVIDFHGQVIPVLALRRRFGQVERAYTLRTPVIIGKLDGRTVGLVVDRVRGVVDLDPEQVAAPEQIFVEGLALRVDHLVGVARQNDGLILLLDPPTLFSEEEASLVESQAKRKSPRRKRRAKKG
jgi:purine-binding chemotaxis protein CheW